MKKKKNIGRNQAKQILFALGFGALALVTNVGYVNANETHDYITLGTNQDVRTVNGNVKDSQGEPLPGVSVIVQGTTNGTMTDVDGNYTLSVPANKKLVFSYVGFKEQVITASKDIINVVLKDDTHVMDEIVVVGYGSQKKENLTGAVFSVKVAETLDSRPIADVGRGLQGVVPGLNVTIPSGEVGSDPTMKIRGNIGSINGKSDPLILVDNVEIPSIQLINPDDIESISVLKDAAASSIYGAKAAFGVVLITTKKGTKSETVDISYSNNFSFQDPSKKIKMGGIDAVRYAMDAYENAGNTFGGAAYKVTRESLERSEEWNQLYGGKLGMNDPIVYGRDWYWDGKFRYGVRLYNPADFMIDKWTPTHNHNLSANGRVGKTTFNISLGLLDQKGMLKPAKADDFRRYNANLRLSTEVNKYLSVRGGMMHSNKRKRSPNTGGYTADPWYYMYRWSPVTPWGVDEYGRELRSPALEMSQAHLAKREDRYTNLSLGLTLKPLENWEIAADYAYSLIDYTYDAPGTRFTGVDVFPGSDVVARTDGFGNQAFVNKFGEQVREGDPGAMPAYEHVYRTYTDEDNGLNSYKRTNATEKRGTWNVFSTYSLNLGNEDMHKFKFMLGMNRVTWEKDSSTGSRKNLFDTQKPQPGQVTGSADWDATSSWDAQLGYFGRVNYSFMDRYLVEANFRRDGSSKFPKGKRWRNFPSFSAGWIASEENFMKVLDPVLSFVKFRGSWGSIGDQTIASSLYSPLMVRRKTAWLDSNNTATMAYRTPDAVQPSLKWQKIETIDIGADFRFWNNKIGLTVDWYQRTTKDMITDGPTLPLTYGRPGAKGNYAELRTRGWELALDFSHTFSFGLTIHGNAAFYDSKSVYTDFYDKSQKSIDGYYVGKAYGEIWGYKTDRLFQEDDFVRDSRGNLVPYIITPEESAVYAGKEVWMQKGDNIVYQPKLQDGKFVFEPGDVKFQDLNGDGFIDDGARQIDDHGDLTIIGNSTPRYEYSFKLGADYKGVDFSIFFQGIGSRKIWADGPLAIPGFQIGDGAMPQAMADNYWTEERTNAFYPRAWNQGTSNTTNNMQRQSKYLLNMAYLRIKNITVGYTLPKEWTEKAFIKKARVYLSLENFFTFDKLRGLPIDPEVNANNSNMFSTNYNSGRVGVGSPTFKSLSFGMQINF